MAERVVSVIHPVLFSEKFLVVYEASIHLILNNHCKFFGVLYLKMYKWVLFLSLFLVTIIFKKVTGNIHGADNFTIIINDLVVIWLISALD